MSEKYYRYELYIDGQYQGVGIFQGLSDLFLEQYEVEYLLCSFNKKLNIPKIDRLDNSCFFFTEYGEKEFKEEIKEIKDVFELYELFEVRKIVVEKDSFYDEDILYEDDYQVALKERTFERRIG